MKNKGFTMIELLAIITILATILLVSFPTLINMTRKDKERQYNDMVATLCKAGETYIYANQEEFPELGQVGEMFELEIQDLIDNKLVERNMKDPKTESLVSDSVLKFKVKEDKSLGCSYEKDATGNILMESRRVIEDYDSAMNSWPDWSRNFADYYFLNTDIYSSKISKFHIYNKIEISEGYNQSDCSYNQDNSVICYWKEDPDNEGYYEMNIATNGILYAPENSSFLFSALGKDKLTNLDLTGLSTKYVKKMRNMFNSTGYNEMIDINLGSRFNTSNVTDMVGMFCWTGHTSMKALDLGNKFDTRNVTDMYEMFYMTGTGAMTSLNLGNKFDTSNVIYMEQMFYSTGSAKLTKLDLGDKFDTSNVTNMYGMFTDTGYESMTTLNLGNKFDTSKVTEMMDMFYNTGYKSMISLNLGNKFDTSNVTNMERMFCNTGYNSMTSLNLGNKFDTSNVTNMYGMFCNTGYNSMTSLSLGNKFDTSNVTDMYEMFEETGYNSMTTLNLGSKFVISDGTKTTNIFRKTGKSGVLTSVIVPNQTLKDKILNLASPSHVPDFWKANDGAIIQIGS